MTEKQWIFCTYVSADEASSFYFEVYESELQEEQGEPPYTIIQTADEFISLIETLPTIEPPLETL